MRKLEECVKYEPEIKRLTKVNSFVYEFVGKDGSDFVEFSRVIYVVKKDNTGKASKIYYAYDYETKIQLLGHRDKDILINYIKQQNLTILENINE